VVALDNLTTNYCGDAGTPSNEGPGGSTGAQNAVINGEPYCLADPGHPGVPNQQDPAFEVHPFAPGMGFASDGPGGLGYNYPSQDPAPDSTEGPPTEKETAALAWKRAKLPTAEYVLAGANHNQFSQSSTSNEVLLHQLAVYTAAWFKRWLGRDPDAASALTSCAVLGQPLTTWLSSSYLSSVYLPAGDGSGSGTDITDLRNKCSNP
jgi:hypothetical protein